MPTYINQTILPILSRIIDPLTGRDLLSLDAVSKLRYLDKRLTLTLTLGYPGEARQDHLVNELGESLTALPEVDKVVVDAQWQAPVTCGIEGKKPLDNVRNVIAVASGKGGVGKSTVTVNLALAMARLGARVGILDADIYGPSQAQMLGAAGQRPHMPHKTLMQPVVAHGIQSMSMGYLLTENTPAVWRGPMATGALQQILFQTEWREVDYLFVDMPPGTGDIQLTLAQQVPVSGAVVVTTPQDIALLDAKKGIEMFRKVNIPILGVVENMAAYHCPQCGYEAPIFGRGGGERIARDYATRLLGAIPLALAIREQTDSGTPTVLAEPDGKIAQTYGDIAENIAALLWLNQLATGELPEILVTDD